MISIFIKPKVNFFSLRERQSHSNPHTDQVSTFFFSEIKFGKTFQTSSSRKKLTFSCFNSSNVRRQSIVCLRLFVSLITLTHVTDSISILFKSQRQCHYIPFVIAKDLTHFNFYYSFSDLKSFRLETSTFF